MSNILKVSNKDLIDLIQKSRLSQRKRTALLLTSNDYRGFQVLYNAIQPESYVCPHRHAKDEVWMPITGKIALITFDKSGKIYEKIELSEKDTKYFFISGGVWHSCFALIPDSIFLNISPGPFNSGEDKDFAPWAPKENLENPEESLAYLKNLKDKFSKKD